ncbi:hypothetical protein Cob_v002156 [Colletotrichum orbiculare MAFF 240422]|uniref:Nucleoside phosphorylase domain-containing protein n=1 Tax=Colletotrichum orbiculare (strain 104-T / ATCC 96160 / CBS 514.97 / LARS 414 / MAFF 240422) TaxID=1213857 RepID=A0A484G480_COLOR|nr:hypothetical protein Cob_v002156 [Colletotrichum orbiculare MAFF 240422]
MSGCSSSHPEDFRIAVICALAREYDAAILAFDDIWHDDDVKQSPSRRPHNNHTWGRIGAHSVALILLPNVGKVSAANEVVRLRSAYPRLELAFLTGLRGGVPGPGTENEILLGDVVIGKSIVQYDLGRQYPGNFCSAQNGINAFEMEGAGIWEEIPCIIVKGVCDYADSHKNKSWQDFAALMAASTTKTLLERYVARNPGNGAITTIPSSFNLAGSSSEYLAVNHFVARSEKLMLMQKALERTGGCRTAVLYGLGGMGKTQLAIAYIKEHRDNYSAVIWLNARDEASLKQSLQRAARRILREHPDVVYIKNAVLNHDVDETAIVYDNYDDVKFNSRDYSNERNGQMAEERHLKSGQIPPETAGSTPYDIRAYLPETDHGAIIITTRSSMVKLGQSIRLKKLGDINDSLAILGSTSDRYDIRQDPDAESLARHLDGLPLALSTAGAYLNLVSTTCAEYIHLYEESWLRLQEESPQLLDYDRALYSTWEVSYKQIQRRNPAAAMLLRFWAYFDNENLCTLYVLGTLYSMQGKEMEAVEMYEKALQGYTMVDFTIACAD